MSCVHTRGGGYNNGIPILHIKAVPELPWCALDWNAIVVIARLLIREVAHMYKDIPLSILNFKSVGPPPHTPWVIFQRWCSNHGLHEMLKHPSWKKKSCVCHCLIPFAYWWFLLVLDMVRMCKMKNVKMSTICNTEHYFHVKTAIISKRPF